MSDKEITEASNADESTGLVERMIERFADRVEHVESETRAGKGESVIRKIVKLRPPGGEAYAPGNRVNTEGFRKVAKIVNDPRLQLAKAREILRSHAKEVIYGAFPAPSRHQTCVDAAAACGTSPDTILRLIEGATANPDVLVLALCARFYSDRTGRETPIHTVLAQIMSAGVTV